MLDCHIITYHLSKAASKLLPLAACAFLAGNLSAQSQAPTDSAANAVQADIAEQQSMSSAKQSFANRNTGELNSIREYEEQVHRLESQYDAYHAGLSEAKTGLALAYQQEGNHEEAISSLETALQISRVNYGLYHVNKIPLIEHLIVSYTATGNWQAVEDRYYTLMQLYSRNFDHNDVELLPGLAMLIKWHMFAFSEKVTEQPLNNLLTAREFMLKAINIIRYNYGVDDLRQLEPFSGLVLIDFYLAVEQSEFRNEVRNPTFDSFQQQTNPSFVESGSIHLSMLTQGRRHIEAMIQITRNNPETPPRVALDILVMLADWNLIFKQKLAADEVYRQVWEQAMTLEDHEQYIDEIFIEPVRVPDFFIYNTTLSGASPSENNDDDTAQGSGGNAAQGSGGNADGQGAIVFEFDISTSGRAVDPELVESDPRASKNVINRARRQLKSSRFRPRYDNGVAVENQNVRIRYLFEPEPAPETETEPEQSAAEARNGE
jgi:tetratricopeptide (TPR) repeat protein